MRKVMGHEGVFMGGSGVSACPPALLPSLVLGPVDSRPAILPRGHRSSRSLSPDSTPRSLAYVRQATGPGMPRPRAKSVRLGGVSAQHADLRHSAAPFWATRVRISPRCSRPNPTAQKFERTRDPIPFSMQPLIPTVSALGWGEGRAGLPTCLRLGCFLSLGWRPRWRPEYIERELGVGGLSEYLLAKICSHSCNRTNTPWLFAQGPHSLCPAWEELFPLMPSFGDQIPC